MKTFTCLYLPLWNYWSLMKMRRNLVPYPPQKNSIVRKMKDLVQLSFSNFRYNMVGIQSKFTHTHDAVLPVVSQQPSWWPEDPQEVSCQLQSNLQQVPGRRPGHFRLWAAEGLGGWRQTSTLAVLAYSLVMYFLGQPYWLLQVPHGKRQLPQSSWLQKALGSAPKPAPGPKHWVGCSTPGLPELPVRPAPWSRDHPSLFLRAMARSGKQQKYQFCLATGPGLKYLTKLKGRNVTEYKGRPQCFAWWRSSVPT